MLCVYLLWLVIVLFNYWENLFFIILCKVICIGINNETLMLVLLRFSWCKMNDFNWLVNSKINLLRRSQLLWFIFFLFFNLFALDLLYIWAFRFLRRRRLLGFIAKALFFFFIDLKVRIIKGWIALMILLLFDSKLLYWRRAILCFTFFNHTIIMILLHLLFIDGAFD